VGEHAAVDFFVGRSMFSKSGNTCCLPAAAAILIFKSGKECPSQRILPAWNATNDRWQDPSASFQPRPPASASSLLLASLRPCPPPPPRQHHLRLCSHLHATSSDTLATTTAPCVCLLASPHLRQSAGRSSF